MSSVGQAVGGVVGAVAGFFVGGPSGALYGAQLGMMAGGYLDPPKGPTVEGPRLDDLTVQTSTYGAVIPRCYGTIATSGNVFWLENNKLKETVKKTKSGGKGGGSSTTTKTYSYYATFAVGLCQGPIDGVRRIWIGGRLWYDAGSSDMGTLMVSNAAALKFTLYRGTDDQLPDDRMQATLGVDNTPAYRGLAYIVFNDLPLADYGNSLLGAQVKVEVVNSISYTNIVHQGVAITPTFSAPYAVTGHEGVLLVGGSAGEYYLSKNGGESFQKMYFGISERAEMFCVNDEGSIYVAFLRTTGSTLRVLSSANGVSWIDRGPLADTISGFFDVVWAKDRFVLTSMYSRSVWSSLDGAVWSEAELALPYSQWHGLSYSPDLDLLCTVSYSNTCLIAVKQREAATWDVYTPPWASLEAYPTNWDVCWGDGEFLVITSVDNSSIWSSSDGINWSLRNAPGIGLRRLEFGGGTWLAISHSSFGFSYSIDKGASWESSESLPNGAYSFWNGAWFCYGGRTGGGYIQVRKATCNSVALDDILQNELLESNVLVPSDINVSELSSRLVRGYKISSVAALRSGIEPLQGAFPFDVIQRGYKIVFKLRGGASVATIQESELDARGVGDSSGISITTVREMDSVLPRKLALSYLDVNREYDIGEQYAERLNTDAINVRNVDMAIVLSADEAAKIAEVLLYLYWMERYSVSFRLPPTYNRLEPGDVITIQTSQGNCNLRLPDITYTQDGRLECQAKYNSAATYVSTAQGVAWAVTPQTLSPIGKSVMALLDIPLMADSSDQAGFVAALCGNNSAWPGGVIVRTDDSGQTWTEIQAFTAPGSAIGSAINSIGATRTDIVDTASLLNVYMDQGALSSVSELAMLNGANWFAYGAHGRWEIIAAKTCALQADGSYRLTDLLRGRKGTEWACGLHAVGDTVVLLDSSVVDFLSASLDSIGKSRIYRGVTAGKEIESASDSEFIYSGVNLECLSPVYLNGNRHPTTNDWTLTWIRRTRVGGEWRDYVDATLGEASESYEVEIYSSNTYTTLKRTLTGLSSATATYTSANQVTDFGSNQATLYVKIYQISANVGRGYPLTTSITR